MPRSVLRASIAESSHYSSSSAERESSVALIPLKRLRKLVSKEMASLIGEAAFVFLLRASGAILVYLTQVLFARWLGATELGSYVLALSWLLILSYIASVGFPFTALRFVPQDMVTGQHGRVRGFVRRGRQIVGLGGLAISGIASATVLLLDHLFSVSNKLPLLAAFMCVPMLAFMLLHQEIARAFSKVVVAFTPNWILRHLLVLLGVWALLNYGGTTLSATGVLLLTAAVLAPLALWQYLAVDRLLRTQVSDAKREYDTPQWLRMALPLLPVFLFTSNFQEINIVVAGGFLTKDQIAIYNAGLRTANLIAFVLYAVNTAVLPRLSEFHGRRDKVSMQRLVARATLLRSGAALAGFLGLIVIGKQVLGLFGPDFAPGYVPLLILAFAQLVIGAAGPVSQLLIVTGHQDDCLRVFSAAIAATVLLNPLFIWQFGMNGAAIATLLVTLGWNSWLQVLVMRRLGIRASIFAAARVLRN